MRDFSLLLLPIDRTYHLKDKKLNRKLPELNNIINQMDLTNIYYILVTKQIQADKNNEITPCFLSVHRGLKLDTNVQLTTEQKMDQGRNVEGN